MSDANQEIRDVLRAFALSEDAATTVLKDDEDSLVLLVGAEAVLKKRRRPDSSKQSQQAKIARLEAAAELEAILSRPEHNALCPAPLSLSATTSGDSKISRVFRFVNHDDDDGDSLWTASRYVANQPVFDWLDEPKMWTDAQARSAGRLLARLHGAVGFGLSSLPEEGAAHSLETLSAAFEKGLVDNALTMQQLEKELGLKDVATTARANIAWSVDKLQNVNAKAAAWGLVHGDFHPGNVLFDGDKALCVIDMDYAYCGQPSFDLAYACITFGQDRAQALVEGYFGGPPELDQWHKTEQFLPLAAAWILLWCFDNWQSKSFAGRLSNVAKLAIGALIQ